MARLNRAAMLFRVPPSEWEGEHKAPRSNCSVYGSLLLRLARGPDHRFSLLHPYPSRVFLVLFLSTVFVPCSFYKLTCVLLSHLLILRQSKVVRAVLSPSDPSTIQCWTCCSSACRSPRSMNHENVIDRPPRDGELTPSISRMSYGSSSLQHLVDIFSETGHLRKFWGIRFPCFHPGIK